MGAILEHLIKDHGASMAEAKMALTAWQIEPITRNGQPIGELMLRENEVHFALDAPYRKVLGRKDLMRDTLDRLFETRDFLVTRLFKHDKLNTLVLFMGFEHTHSDQMYNYYWMNKESRNDRA